MEVACTLIYDKELMDRLHQLQQKDISVEEYQ